MTETEDGLRITPKPLRGGRFHSYHDHRMATAGAVVGLRVPGVSVEDVADDDQDAPRLRRPVGRHARTPTPLGSLSRRSRWKHLDESDVRVRPNPRGSRRRTKKRPAHEDAVPGFVTAVDRGRYTVLVAAGVGGRNEPARIVTAMKARELGRKGVVVGRRGRARRRHGRRTGCPGPHRARRAPPLDPASHRRRHRPGRAGHRGQRRPARRRLVAVRPRAPAPPHRPVPRRRVRRRPRPAPAPHQGRPHRPGATSCAPTPRSRSPTSSRRGVARCASRPVPRRSSPTSPGSTRYASGSTAGSRCSSATPASASRRWSTASSRERARHRRRQRRDRPRTPHLDLGGGPAPAGDGGWVVDTPGVRSFGLAHVDPAR